uniref:DUF211 domain-containing protein n=1 Tax=Ignisphaera aggregans TaxID=334771 RepID=A0A7C5Z429_9CREN
MGITKLVLDVLKTLKGPTIIDVAHRLLEIKGIDKISIKVNEIDVETLTLTITIEGFKIDFESIKSVLDDMGAVIHSVDEVVAARDS